jgi:hypothetical protein
MLNTNRSQHPLDRGLGKGRGDVSLSAFAFLFSELVQYHQSRVASIGDLERRLEESGYSVGLRVLELFCFRDGTSKGAKRETRLLGVLQFVSTKVWKGLFGKDADSLERSMDNEDEYMIHEQTPMTNTFISTPPTLGSLNVAAYISGIIAGCLNGASFPARVTAHTVKSESGDASKDKTVFLLKFAPEVMERDAVFDR